MPNKGKIVEVRIMKLFMIAYIPFFPIYFCKRLIAFSCKDSFLERTKICSSKFSLLSIVIPNSFTDFNVLIVMSSIFNVILVLLFVFPCCNTIVWNLSGFTIILLFLKHFTADSDSSFKIFKRSPVLFASAEIVLSYAKLYNCDFLKPVGRSLRNILKNIGPNTEPCGTHDNKV